MGDKKTSKAHGQFGRVNSIIVSFCIDLGTLATIDAICAQSAINCGVPMSRSEWIKRAIARDLHHRERGKKCRRKKAPRGGQSN